MRSVEIRSDEMDEVPMMLMATIFKDIRTLSQSRLHIGQWGGQGSLYQTRVGSVRPFWHNTVTDRRIDGHRLTANTVLYSAPSRG